MKNANPSPTPPAGGAVSASEQACHEADQQFPTNRPAVRPSNRESYRILRMWTLWTRPNIAK